jgi:hypothetical protein
VDPPVNKEKVKVGSLQSSVSKHTVYATFGVQDGAREIWLYVTAGKTNIQFLQRKNDSDGLWQVIKDPYPDDKATRRETFINWEFDRILKVTAVPKSNKQPTTIIVDETTRMPFPEERWAALEEAMRTWTPETT